MFVCATTHLPNKSSFMSLAACSPSSLRFFSICLLRSRAALSSAECPQPILRPTSFTNVATPVSVQRVRETHSSPTRSPSRTQVSDHPLVDWLLQIFTTSLERTPRHTTEHRTDSINFTFLFTAETELPANLFTLVYLPSTKWNQMKRTFP